MKQKVVLNVSVNGCKSRPSMEKFVLGCLVPCLVQDATCKNKVMSIAATLSGVEKVSIEVEKNELTVIGEGIDPVKLVNILRKKVGYAKMVSVGPEKKEEKPAEETVQPVLTVPHVVCCNNSNRVPHMVEMWEVDPYYSNTSCLPFR
ncbi:heavy metal-associated isoprenylated plant protein 47-like [Nicotiana tomentosiformis]|uniref:heavy metal-associated isoprenylated plant protein 47-like n=1 Tax=Nicotiana tomentosiformis TaxID=4098 RepID=UPI00051C7F2F|nr:disease resistance protein Pik-1-like [Nicotiana tomentosiformis]